MSLAGQGSDSIGAAPTNGATSAHDLFVLTDEQILEIEPEGDVNVAPGGIYPDLVGSPASSAAPAHGNGAAPAVIPSEPGPPASPGLARWGGEARDHANISESSKSPSARHDSSSPVASRNDKLGQGAPDVASTSHQSPIASHDSPEPPPWLAAQMEDSRGGGEARELWNGVLQARSEAAAYRAAFATPEDARALKELYPGGVNEARSAASRARLLEEIDRAYFGVPNGSAEQTSSARADLAQHMLREDPAAFREMVFAGLRALEAAEEGSGTSRNASNLPRLAQAFAANRRDVDVAPPFRAASSPASPTNLAENAGQKPGATQNPHESTVTNHESHFTAYTAFEKAANEDLERSVGVAIARTIEQALPNLQRGSDRGPAGARSNVALQDRLTAAVRQDVESALKGDRQLGEQIAQILSARRFDNETRAQVVRLIDDRARQLVPSAAKRVITDWTQTTLAAHRGNASRSDSASARREVEPAARGPLAQGESASSAALSSHPGAAPSSRAAQTRPGANPHRNASRSDGRRLDYRKLSDEQILEL